MFRLAFAAMLLVTGWAIAPAGAQNITAANPQGVVQLLEAQGFKASLQAEPDADPVIYSEVGGTPFAVFFFDCAAHKRCKTVQFYAGFRHGGVSFERINAWNARNRFGRAYIDDEGDPRMEMDVNLDPGGVNPGLFRETLDTWTGLVAAFKDHIGF